MKKSSRHWYNNGIVDKIFADDDLIPVEFHIGKLPRSKEHCNKISLAKKGKTISQETRDKIRHTLSGRAVSAETRQKIKKKLNGKLKDYKYYNNGKIEIRLKSSEICPTGFIPGRLAMTAAQKIKISKANTGKIRSEEAKALNRQKHLGKQYSEETNHKRIETKRKNGTLNSSSDEVIFNSFLIKVIGQDNFVKEYNSTRYPFNCDFYIQKFDLYIELHHHWTHGKHAYNKENIEDAKRLKTLEVKAKASKFYKTAIYVWTKLDPLKLKIAKENNLNYLVSYNKEDMYKIMEYIKQLIKETR